MPFLQEKIQQQSKHLVNAAVKRAFEENPRRGKMNKKSTSDLGRSVKEKEIVTDIQN